MKQEMIYKIAKIVGNVLFAILGVILVFVYIHLLVFKYYHTNMLTFSHIHFFKLVVIVWPLPLQPMI